MARIFGTRKASKHPKHAETIGALALRWRLGGPLDRRAGSDMGFAPLCRKECEAVEEVLMYAHTETG
jgi:hypothetical protein